MTSFCVQGGRGGKKSDFHAYVLIERSLMVNIRPAFTAGKKGWRSKFAGLGTHFTDQRSSALSARSLQHLHLELNTARAQGQLLLSLIQLNLYSSTLLELNLYSSTFLQLNL